MIAAQLTVTSGYVAAGARCVDQPRDDLLADAAFAGDQDLGVRARSRPMSSRSDWIARLLPISLS